MAQPTFNLVSKLDGKSIEIFRAGNYGAKGLFTEADLDRVVAGYKPAEHEAPVVIGHPQNNGPAWGWVTSLKREGDKLLATFGQVQPEFAEMVASGLYKKRSASFYRDPQTRMITGLRHVGFLGAQPPDVKGLSDVQFEDEGREVTEVAFEENDMDPNDKKLEDTLFERLKSLFKPAEATAPTFSETDLSKAVELAVKPMRDDLEKYKTDFVESQKKSATATVKTRAAEAIAKLKASGRWVPAFEKAGLPVVFEELAKADEVVEFGEGNSKQSKTPLDAFVSFMEELPKIVPNAPIYTGQGAEAKTKVAGINESSRASVDPNSVQLDALAQARATEKGIDYGAALTQIAAEKPELTKPGGAAAGAV